MLPTPKILRKEVSNDTNTILKHNFGKNCIQNRSMHIGPYTSKDSRTQLYLEGVFLDFSARASHILVRFASVLGFVFFNGPALSPQLYMLTNGFKRDGPVSLCGRNKIPMINQNSWAQSLKLRTSLPMNQARWACPIHCKQ